VTALCGALYGVLAKRALVRYPAPTVITYGMLLGTLLLVPLALVEGLGQVLPRLDRQAMALILFLGLFPSALGYLLWTFALGRLMPTQVMVYGNLMPPLTAVLGVALLAETLTVLFQVSFVAVLAGVLLVNWPQRQEPTGVGPPSGPRLQPVGSPGPVARDATA
jgi:drug/metabolite transporter (DMT)-like permease